MEILASQVSGKLLVNVAKCDNGYIVTLIEPPKGPKKRTVAKDLDAEIDSLLDGITALNQHMRKGHGNDEGENWRGGGSPEDRQKVREAFKKLHPEFFEMPCEPRIEQKVFGTKKDLFSYLTDNL
jgi:hypothetical protein